MTVAPTKIDSNITGLSVTIEQSIGVLPATTVWQQLEPNSYKNWGGQLTLTARNPINPTRQQRKGSITDNKVGGGYMTDFKVDNLDPLIPGFFFAAPREKFNNTPFNAAKVAVTSVAADVVTFAAAPAGAVVPGSLAFKTGFGMPGNNGLSVVTTVAGGGAQLTLSGGADEPAPPVAASVRVVGVQGAAGDIGISVSGGIVEATSTVLDFTTLGLIPGEWTYIGGDTAVTAFGTQANNGFARISDINPHSLVFDKTDGTMVTDTGAAKTIQMFFGSITKNETQSNLINRYTYQFQRTLGQDQFGTSAEYLIGSVPNELSLAIKAATLASADVTVTGIDNHSQDGTVALKSSAVSATLLPPSATGAFNTVSDFSRIRLYTTNGANNGNTNPVPLVAYIMDAAINLKNNLSPDNAIGVLGPFDQTAGNFEIMGTLTCYFANVSAIQAVRNNADVTLDIAVTKQNAGILLDIPLLALGEGRLTVAKDKPVELPLSIMGAQHPVYGWTASWTRFFYLPTVIAP